MLRYILRRLCLMLFVLLCVSVITFSLMHVVPGDPAEIIAEQRYGEDATGQVVEMVREEKGLDQPLITQYVNWLGGILQGDFGESFRTQRPVFQEIMSRIPATAELALAAMAVSLAIAIPVGIISATRQYSFLDNLSTIGAMLGVSVPNFWLGMILILIFSVHFGWLPVYGRGDLQHLVLVAVTLGTGMAAVTTRMIRSSMLEVLKQDYIRTARAKGLNEKTVLYKHALKNAFIPVITIVGLQFGALLEGAVVVEIVFAWPGIGRLLVDSVQARDFPAVQGCVLVIAFIYVVVNLLVDISYAFLDPKVRLEYRDLLRG